MLFVSTLIAVFTISAPTASTNDLVFVIDHLDHAIEWTSANRTETLSRNQAIRKLQDLTHKEGASFKLKHQSKWKNGRSYRVIQLTTDGENYRIFFLCKKVRSKTVVTRVKVTKL